jgi:hypothetical protein
VLPLRRKKLDDVLASARRGFHEFLKVPILVVLAFLALAIAADLLDRSDIVVVRHARQFIQNFVFGKAQGTRDLMGSIASGVITMTSITISVLLVAVQQSSTNLTPLVFDQFLRRRQNQIYFGYFVGLAIHALLVLASVDGPFVPVLGASLTLLLTVGSLVMMVLLLYTTIDQMRPAQIIESIHDHVLRAKVRRERLLAATRRAPAWRDGHRRPVRALREGFVTELDLRRVDRFRKRSRGTPFEIVYTVSVGTYVACHDTIGEIRYGAADQVEPLERLARAGLHLQNERDLTIDPSYGLEELQTIAWTSISSAKQNQSPGLLCIRALRDILSRWGDHGGDPDSAPPAPLPEPLPIVYNDRLIDDLLNTFEALATITSESLQEQCYTEVLVSVASCFPRMRREVQDRLADLTLRILSGLGDHVLTLPLEQRLIEVARAFADGGRPEAAAAVEQARRQLKDTVGKLGSRGSRVRVAS